MHWLRLGPQCCFSNTSLHLPSPADRSSFGVGVMVRSTCLVSMSAGPQEPHRKLAFSHVCIELQTELSRGKEANP